MTFDLSKPVQTRDGRKVRIICTDRRETPWPIVALVGDDERIESFNENGKFPGEDFHGSNLINIPKEHEVVVHFYRGGGDVIYVSVGPVANKLASKRITFTEGEFEE